MWQIAILTSICLIGATTGYYFLEGMWLRTTLYLLGWTIWGLATFVWWFIPLLDKFIK